MRKVVATSSSRTSLDIGFSLKMDRRAFVNLNLYVVFYWSSVCKRVVCFSLSYVLSVKLCGKNVKTYIKGLACCDPTLHKPGVGSFSTRPSLFVIQSLLIFCDIVNVDARLVGPGFVGEVKIGVVVCEASARLPGLPLVLEEHTSPYGEGDDTI